MREDLCRYLDFASSTRPSSEVLLKNCLATIAFVIFGSQAHAAMIEFGQTQDEPNWLSPPALELAPADTHAYNLGINAELLRDPKPQANLVSFGTSAGFSGSGAGGLSGGFGGSPGGTSGGGGASGGGGGGGSGGASTPAAQRLSFPSAQQNPQFNPSSQAQATPPAPLVAQSLLPPSPALPVLPAAPATTPIRTTNVPAVPLPGSLALMAAALFILGVVRHGRSRAFGSQM